MNNNVNKTFPSVDVKSKVINQHTHSQLTKNGEKQEMIGQFERSALQEKKTMYTKYCEKSTKITEETLKRDIRSPSYEKNITILTDNHTYYLCLIGT